MKQALIYIGMLLLAISCGRNRDRLHTGDLLFQAGKNTEMTYPLLRQAEAALVTSGTATLETALFRVPQAVCYHTPIGKVIAFLKRHILKVKYISLVNLIANREVVKELVADTMTVEQVRSELNRILYDKEYRRQMLEIILNDLEFLFEKGSPGFFITLGHCFGSF